MAAPAYPVILTATDWNAKKGAVAKLLPNTKLGEELRKAEAAYKGVNWEPLQHVPGVGATVKDVDEQTAKCIAVMKPQLDHAKGTLGEAETLAKQVKAGWASNKLVPSDSRKHLDALIGAIDTFVKAIDAEVAAGLKQFQQLRMKLAELNPHQVSGDKESAAAVVRTGGNVPTGPVVVGLKPRAPAGGTAK